MDIIDENEWYCSGSEPDTFFVNECDIESCVTEKILRNKFYDPMASSDEEDLNTKKTNINWDEVFGKKQNYVNRKYVNVPGMKMLPFYPKLSSLTSQQHYQCLKVICADNPHILEAEFIPRPTKQDHKVFQECKDQYLKEQQEYKEWAKQQWITSHCIRALRPKPIIEMVYEAEFKLKAYVIKAFPKHYKMAAQIPLETKNAVCDFVLLEDIVKVDIESLPEIQVESMITKKFMMISESSIPETCTKHPCRFVLPNESSMTILPLPEVHRELAHFATEHEVSFIMSESALRCFIEQGRPWQLALTVCEVVKEDGDKVNVMVVSNEFSLEKQPAQERSYRAYRHLLRGALIPHSERQRLLKSRQENAKEKTPEIVQEIPVNDCSDDEDETALFIDTGEGNATMDWSQDTQNTDIDNPEDTNIDKTDGKTRDETANISNESIHDESQIKIYDCTCKDTEFETPAPRSYRKWKITNTRTKESYDLIIHCSHKTRNGSNEIVLEPIVEYQIDLGGSTQPEEKVTSLAMALQLRNNANLVNARIDGPTGELVTLDSLSQEDLIQNHNAALQRAYNCIFTIINQLQGLLPGQYILNHASNHAANAFLYATKNTGSEEKLQLDFAGEQLNEMEEAKLVKTPPNLTDVLLPYHKFRKLLPCAFSPHQKQVAREQRKTITRQKNPPRAALWPKRKKRGRRKRH